MRILIDIRDNYRINYSIPIRKPMMLVKNHLIMNHKRNLKIFKIQKKLVNKLEIKQCLQNNKLEKILQIILIINHNKVIMI